MQEIVLLRCTKKYLSSKYQIGKKTACQSNIYIFSTDHTKYLKKKKKIFKADVILNWKHPRANKILLPDILLEPRREWNALWKNLNGQELSWYFCQEISFFLASQDALEAMLFTDWVGVSIDLTDVTLVSDDT